MTGTWLPEIAVSDVPTPTTVHCRTKLPWPRIEFPPQSGLRITSEERTSEYVKNVFVGVCESLAELDEELEAASNKWKLSRMSTATRSVLRMALYEMTVCEVPPKAEINEAVEIIKQYDEDSAPAFVNGILNRIARDRGLIEA